MIRGKGGRISEITDIALRVLECKMSELIWKEWKLVVAKPLFRLLFVFLLDWTMGNIQLMQPQRSISIGENNQRITPQIYK